MISRGAPGRAWVSEGGGAAKEEGGGGLPEPGAPRGRGRGRRRREGEVVGQAEEEGWRPVGDRRRRAERTPDATAVGFAGRERLGSGAAVMGAVARGAVKALTSVEAGRGGG